MESTTFVALGLAPALTKTLADLGLESPTPVQAEAIPVILEGRDLIASAPTGTGKTAAFLLPVMHRLVSDQKPGRGPRALVLSPTRELAQQIAKAAGSFSQGLGRMKTVCIMGGESYRIQQQNLSQPYEILVATPGRLMDQMDSGRIDLSRVEVLVLDEADRMLDIGFTEAVLEIAAKLPQGRQTLCFTATVSHGVETISRQLLKDPHRINVGGDNHRRDNISQHLVYVDSDDHKQQLLRHWLGTEVTGQVIVFTATKRDADEIAHVLAGEGESAVALHGDLSQRDRKRMLDSMRRGDSRVLIATDVAARGIDVAGISHVINYDLPRFAEDYVHRIGRTGRAGATGNAVSFVGRRDMGALFRIERFVGSRLDETKVEGMESMFRPEAQNGRGRRGGPHGGKGQGRGGRPQGQGPRHGGHRGQGGDARAPGPRHGGPRDQHAPQQDARPPRPSRENYDGESDDDRQPAFLMNEDFGNRAADTPPRRQHGGQQRGRDGNSPRAPREGGFRGKQQGDRGSRFGGEQRGERRGPPRGDHPQGDQRGDRRNDRGDQARGERGNRFGDRGPRQNNDARGGQRDDRRPRVGQGAGPGGDRGPRRNDRNDRGDRGPRREGGWQPRGDDDSRGNRFGDKPQGAGARGPRTGGPGGGQQRRGGKPGGGGRRGYREERVLTGFGEREPRQTYGYRPDKPQKPVKVERVERKYAVKVVRDDAGAPKAERKGDRSKLSLKRKEREED